MHKKFYIGKCLYKIVYYLLLHFNSENIQNPKEIKNNHIYYKTQPNFFNKGKIGATISLFR